MNSFQYFSIIVLDTTAKLPNTETEQGHKKNTK